MKFEFFEGVGLGLGDSRDFQGIYYHEYKLKFVYIDYLDTYAFFFSRKGDRPLHDFLVDLVIESFRGVYRRSPRDSDLPLPDLVYAGCNYEIETGLKHDLGSLVKRLRSSDLFSYVLVPNSEIKKRYKYQFHERKLYSFHGRLYTLKEYFNAI